jgi:hypothetical protein
MTYGYGTVAGGRYQYPSADAEFTLYNFHSQQQVDELADSDVLLTEKHKRQLRRWSVSVKSWEETGDPHPMDKAFERFKASLKKKVKKR